MLALDTATEACSVALTCDGEIHEEFSIAIRQHNRLLLEMCDTVLASANLSVERLDALAFGRGPGAFTGVRIATAAAQGIAYAHRLPVIPVSDLATLAQQLLDGCGGESALATIDARMGEVYYGCFRRGADGLGKAEGEEHVASPEKIMALDMKFDCIGGSGLASYPQLGEKGRRTEPDLLPRAGAMLRLAAVKFKSGKTLQASQIAPDYVRDHVV